MSSCADDTVLDGDDDAAEVVALDADDVTTTPSLLSRRVDAREGPEKGRRPEEEGMTRVACGLGGAKAKHPPTRAAAAATSSSSGSSRISRVISSGGCARTIATAGAAVVVAVARPAVVVCNVQRPASVSPFVVVVVVLLLRLALQLIIIIILLLYASGGEGRGRERKKGCVEREKARAREC
jgi:hypothetical protein